MPFLSIEKRYNMYTFYLLKSSLWILFLTNYQFHVIMKAPIQFSQKLTNTRNTKGLMCRKIQNRFYVRNTFYIRGEGCMGFKIIDGIYLNYEVYYLESRSCFAPLKKILTTIVTNVNVWKYGQNRFFISVYINGELSSVVYVTVGIPLIKIEILKMARNPYLSRYSYIYFF